MSAVSIASTPPLSAMPIMKKIKDVYYAVCAMRRDKTRMYFLYPPPSPHHPTFFFFDVIFPNITCGLNLSFFAGTTHYSGMSSVNAQLDKLRKLSCLLGFFALTQCLLEHTCLDKSSRIPIG